MARRICKTNNLTLASHLETGFFVKIIAAISVLMRTVWVGKAVQMERALVYEFTTELEVHKFFFKISH